MCKWKYIEGFGKDYKIWINGTIYSNKSKKRIKWSNHTSGYVKVDLFQQGRRFTKLVHRLTAYYFVPNPNDEKYVNHLDEDKKNPHAKNLEWVSQSENIKYYYGQRNKKVEDKDLPF